jgi:hypothetical protein
VPGDYDLMREFLLSVSARQPEAGFRVTLTFPAAPASGGLEPFKARIVRLVLNRGGHEDERGCDLSGLDREAGEAGW